MLDADAAVALVLSNDTPYTSAIASQTQGVARNTAVTLTGTAMPGTNGSAVTSVEWTQLSGPAVSIANASSNTATITTPATSTDNLLVFRFRALAAATAKTSDSYVSINMVSTASTSAPAAAGGGGGGAMDFSALIGLAVFALAAAWQRHTAPGAH